MATEHSQATSLGAWAGLIVVVASVVLAATMGAAGSWFDGHRATSRAQAVVQLSGDGSVPNDATLVRFVGEDVEITRGALGPDPADLRGFVPGDRVPAGWTSVKVRGGLALVGQPDLGAPWSSIVLALLTFGACLGAVVWWWVDRRIRVLHLLLPPEGEEEPIWHMEDDITLLAHRIDALKFSRDEASEVGRVAKRYVGERVFSDLMEGHVRPEGGQERVVTVVFTDLAGYSSLSERAAPQVMLTLLNDVLGRCTEAVERLGGSVIDFYGDGMLAIFGAPQSLADHADRAIDAVQAIEDAVDDLNRIWREDLRVPWEAAGVERLVLRAGVHTGRVILADVGGKRRLKYTAVGDAVNVASRLEQLNKVMGTRVLVTAEVMGASSRTIDAQDLGWVQVRGRDHAVHVYGLELEGERRLRADLNPAPNTSGLR